MKAIKPGSIVRAGQLRVKIGRRIYDASEMPIMLILTAKDKQNIRRMPADKMKYLVFPKWFNHQRLATFVNPEMPILAERLKVQKRRKAR